MTGIRGKSTIKLWLEKKKKIKHAFFKEELQGTFLFSYAV